MKQSEGESSAKIEGTAAEINGILGGVIEGVGIMSNILEIKDIGDAGKEYHTSGLTKCM